MSNKFYLCAGLLWTGAAYAAPTKKPSIAIAAKTPRPAFFVDPRARQIFGRTAQIYSAADALQIQWNNRSVAHGESRSPKIASPLITMETMTIDYQKNQKLRVEQRGSDTQWQLVIDGNNLAFADSAGAKDFQFQAFSMNLSGLKNVIKKPKYRVEKLGKDDVRTQVYLSLDSVLDEMTPKLGKWLLGYNLLSDESVRAQIAIADLKEMRAIILPAQIFHGQLCDLVRISTRQDGLVPGKGPYVKQETTWFSQKDGRVLRLQERSQLGSSPAYESDLQVTRQDFAPQFSAQIWKFVLPAYASASK